MTKIVGSMKTKRIGYIAIAAMIVAFSVLFPIHVETPEPDTYVFRIGNIVTAHDPDATCDGVDDNVQFQQLLDALPSDVGGRIEVEAGYYSWDTGETVTRNISNVTIIGVGGLVSFDGDDTTALFTAGGDNWRFENIVTDAGGIDLGSTSDYLLLNVLVDTTFYALVTDDIDILDHGARHESGGDDEIKLDDLGTPDDNTDLDASTERHGLLPKLAGNTSLYLRSDGTWQPAGTGSGDMLKSTYDTDEDGLIDAAAGGTEWDSSAITGVAYITAGTWSSKTLGIADTNIVVVDGTANLGEHCKFTASGIDGLTAAELLADLSGDAAAQFDWNGQNLANVGTVDGRDVSADGTKLDGIEAGADVTDATNVNAAGAVMESDFDATTFLYATLDNTPETKTPAQTLAILSGVAAAAFDFNGQNIINVGTVDGRDVSADGGKLDGIEAGADVTDATNVAAAGAVMESDFDATTFLYATSDNTPEAKTPAEVRTILEVADTTTESITLYVDAGSGSDENAGTSGSPKATIQGALDALPTIIAHTCYIYVRGQQSYAESDTELSFGRFNTLAAIIIKAVNANDEDMYDTSQASGGGNDYLDDSGESWSEDQFNGAYIWIYEGTGKGQIRTISDTTSTRITVSVAWGTNPDATSYYVIGGGATMSGTSAYHFNIVGKYVSIYGFAHTGHTAYGVRHHNFASGGALYNYSSVNGGVISSGWSSTSIYYNYISGSFSYGIVAGSTSDNTIRANVITAKTMAGIYLYRVSISVMGSAGSLNYLFSNSGYGIKIEQGAGCLAATTQGYGTGGDANGTDYGSDSGTTSWYT